LQIDADCGGHKDPFMGYESKCSNFDSDDEKTKDEVLNVDNDSSDHESDMCAEGAEESCKESTVNMSTFNLAQQESRIPCTTSATIVQSTVTSSFIGNQQIMILLFVD
jgi:hypothetical protein